MRNAAAAPALLVLALMVGASGCGGHATDNADPTLAPATSTTPITRTPTATATVSPRASVRPFPEEVLAEDGGYGSGNGLGLTGVRVARHPGFDRVVFDLGGTGRPGWHAEYTTRPRYDGSGDPVRLKGTVVLQVILRGLGLPVDTGVAQSGDTLTRIPGDGTQGVAEIEPGGVFEGDQEAFIGLTGARRPFRVFVLAHPTRVVVDVQSD
jgi:hypothetical protein